MSTPSATMRLSPALTASFWVALAALYFTSSHSLLFVIAIIAVWPHFVTARLPRDASATWILRLLIYGGVFAFFGGRPGIGADWIFDAKTFNAIGLLAAGEATLQLWREPPPHTRYYPATIFCIGVVFLAACNTYDDRYIPYFVPLYLGATLLALREWRSPVSIPVATLPLPRFAVIATVLAAGFAVHAGIVQNRAKMEYWAWRMMQRRIWENGGISNQPMLRSTFNLQGSTRRVLKIEGALNDGHLRAAAFDTYAGGRWSPALSERQKATFPESPAPALNVSTHRAQITKLQDLDFLVFAPLNAVAVVPAAGSSFDWNKTLGPLRCDDPVPVSYDIIWSDKGEELGVPLHQGVLCEPVAPRDAARWLQLPPEIGARVRALAFDLTATATHPAEKVEAVVEYLLQNHKYARTVRRGSGDPVSNFLLEKKSAHCEYFASATVILLRAAGVPARYVTGYFAHESSDGGTVVRARDAHAWAEAWIDGVGWITVDATPADGAPPQNPPVPVWQKTWEKWQDAFARRRGQLRALSRPQLFALISVVILLWAFERWRLRRKSAVAAPAFKYSAPPDLQALAARFERVLQKRVEVSPARPLGEYLQSERDAAARRFLREYQRARFGQMHDQHTLRELTRQIEQLEKTGLENTGLSKGNAHDTALHNHVENGNIAQRHHAQRTRTES